MSASKFSKFLQEEPLGLAASYAFVFHSIAFFFISLPLSPSINSLTSFPTWFLFTSPFISTPIPHLLQANQQLVCCYEKNCKQVNETLQLTLSSVKLSNTPIAGCFKIWSCGHQLASLPLSFVSARNSGGKMLDTAPSVSESIFAVSQNPSKF